PNRPDGHPDFTAFLLTWRWSGPKRESPARCSDSAGPRWLEETTAMLEEAWVARKALCLRRRRERSPRRPTANPSPFFQRALIRNDLPADDVHVERQRLIARSSNLDVVTFRGKGTTFDLIS